MEIERQSWNGCCLLIEGYSTWKYKHSATTCFIWILETIIKPAAVVAVLLSGSTFLSIDTLLEGINRDLNCVYLTNRLLPVPNPSLKTKYDFDIKKKPAMIRKDIFSWALTNRLNSDCRLVNRKSVKQYQQIDLLVNIGSLTVI